MSILQLLDVLFHLQFAVNWSHHMKFEISDDVSTDNSFSGFRADDERVVEPDAKTPSHLPVPLN
jgi:hypothetical protein